VYFAGYDQGAALPTVWRVHPDGSGLETAGPGYGATEPDIAPDNDLLAYVSTVDTSACNLHLPAVLSMVRLSTGVVTCPLPGITSVHPRWSPTGDRIAFLGDLFSPIYTIQADGTGFTTVSPPGRRYYAARVAWSPDGEWLMAKNVDTGALELIRLADQLVLPLGWSGVLESPAWRP
jgi:Tol biopolymer transport system component